MSRSKARKIGENPSVVGTWYVKEKEKAYEIGNIKKE